jgi:hypothetical protein
MSGLSEKIISSVLVVIMVGLVGYNVFSVEMRKIEAQRQLEEIARLEEERARIEREMLEEIKSKETKELVEYYQNYNLLKTEFVKKAAELSEKMEGEIINIEQLKELTTQRLNAAEDFRRKLTQIGDVPGPLETFYDYELEFIASDIETMSLVWSYYNSSNYSTFDDSEIEELYKNTNLLLLKAEEELQRVYSQYDLEYLLEESS